MSPTSNMTVHSQIIQTIKKLNHKLGFESNWPAATIAAEMNGKSRSVAQHLSQMEKKGLIRCKVQTGIPWLYWGLA
jgi:hypothetical protein